VLAGIGEVESGDGSNDGPSSAGALGPVQFLPATRAIYGDGGNIMNPADAIPAAARLLLANGAPGNIPAAIFAYNHSADYVQDVLSWANRYASGGYTVSVNQQADCTLEAIRQAPSAIAAQIVSYAMAQIDKPYIWGGTGPAGFDCSGLVYAAYRGVGIVLPRTTFGMWDLPTHIPGRDAEPGDIVFFNTGPGTAPDHPGHAGLVIGNGQPAGCRQRREPGLSLDGGTDGAERTDGKAIARRRGKEIATTAISRKLLTRACHLLTDAGTAGAGVGEQIEPVGVNLGRRIGPGIDTVSVA
jgi:hypothetical protein